MGEDPACSAPRGAQGCDISMISLEPAAKRMRRVCAVTRDQAIAELVRDGVKDGTVEILAAGADLIQDLTAITRELPRLIFVDVTSIIDGFRAIQFVKSSSIVRRVPIVAIVRLGQPDVEDECAVADRVLCFPFAADEVAELVIRMTQHGRW